MCRHVAKGFGVLRMIMGCASFFPAAGWEEEKVKSGVRVALAELRSGGGVL